MQGITKLIAGDSLDFVTAVAAYPASDGWTLSYRLVPRFATPTQAPITLTATTYQVSDYRVQETPATSAAWAAGAYGWASYVSKSGQRITLEQAGELTIAPDPGAIVQGIDTRSDAQIGLDNVRAVLRGRASDGVLSYTINGRSLQRYGVAELLLLESKLAADVSRETRAAALAAGRYDPRKVYARVARA